MAHVRQVKFCLPGVFPTDWPISYELNNFERDVKLKKIKINKKRSKNIFCNNQDRASSFLGNTIAMEA